MIKHDQVAMVSLRPTKYYIGAIRRLVQLLCNVMGADVDFLPYGHPSDYVPVCVDCSCGYAIYGRIDTFNTMGVQCPSCQKQYSVYSDGEKCWFMGGFIKAEEWPQGESDANQT